MRILLVLALITACGKDEVISPTPKRLQVGESAQFVLDTEESTDIFRSGKLTLSVTSIDDVETTVSAKASLKTVFGEQTIEIAKPIENEILSEQFLVRLRKETRYRAKLMTLDYSGTQSECDVIRVSEIDGQPGVNLEPTLCLDAQTIPKLVVKIGVIKAAFRQSN